MSSTERTNARGAQSTARCADSEKTTERYLTEPARVAHVRHARAYGAIVRAVLVVNPQATATTAGGRDVLAHALASEAKLEIVETDYRGHAYAVARDAAQQGIDLVVAHGGDGTVNEVVNGLLVHTGEAPNSDARIPTLGVVPGGSANVFARAVGLPRDPVDATHRLLHAIETGNTRRVGLGIADGHWFTFNAGLGWDADVVAGVDRRRGKKTGPWLYTRAALACYFRPPHGRARLRVELPPIDDEASDDEPAADDLAADEQPAGNPFEVRTAFISNTDPWSYLGPTPVRLNAGCSFDTGLGLLGLHSLGAPTVLRQLRRALSARGARAGKRVVRHDDVRRVRITSDDEVNFQVDGDLVGLRKEVEFRNVPGALAVAV